MTAATFEQVHSEFLAIVEALPTDYAYEWATAGKALYVHGDCPGCIVARWLHGYRGVGLHHLVAMEGISGPSVVLQLMATDVLPIDLLDHPSSAQLLKFLQTVQGCQDQGATWREALETAHKLVTTPPWSLLLAPPYLPRDG